MKAPPTWFLVCGLLCLPAKLFAQYTLLYSTNGNVITLDGRSGDLPSTLTIPSFVNVIAETLFVGVSNLTVLTIPSSVSFIGVETFQGCTNLSSVSIGTDAAPGSGATTIGGGAFNDCLQLTNLAIGNGVTNIEGSFIGCSSLSAIMLPAGLLAMDSGTFGNCTNLKAITVDSQNPNYASVNGILFDKSETTLAEYPSGRSCPSYIIPHSITNVPQFAFWGCAYLTNLLFTGNALDLYLATFYEDPQLTVYYLPGTTGWEHVQVSPPLVLWNPSIQIGNGLSIRSNPFAFDITGTSNIPIQIVATANLGSGNWSPLQTCSLTNGSIKFSDSGSLNIPNRFYTVQFP